MNKEKEPLQLGLFPGSEIPAEQMQTRKGSCKGKKVADVPVSPDVQLPPDWLESKEFQLIVERESVRVKFEAFWLRSAKVHHFEFFGKTISSTGYRSDFVNSEQAIKWETPLSYATEQAAELHAALLKEQKRQQRKSKKLRTVSNETIDKCQCTS